VRNPGEAGPEAGTTRVRRVVGWMRAHALVVRSGAARGLSGNVVRLGSSMAAPWP